MADDFGQDEQENVEQTQDPVTVPELTFDTASEDEIATGLALLQKDNLRKKRIKAGEIKGGQVWGDMTDEQKAQRLLYSRRRSAKQVLYVIKAEEAGITVSDEEIDAHIAANEG